MKKLLVLSLISLFVCNVQVFSEQNENYDIINNSNLFEKQEENDSKMNSAEKKARKLKNAIDSFTFNNKRYDKEDILNKFSEWTNRKIKALEQTNPEILEDINYFTYYLLGAAQQSKEDTGKKSNWKSWENSFSDFKKSIKGSKKSSTHEMLNVFIYAFSSSKLSDKNKEKIREKLKSEFNDILEKNFLKN